MHQSKVISNGFGDELNSQPGCLGLGPLTGATSRRRVCAQRQCELPALFRETSLSVLVRAGVVERGAIALRLGLRTHSENSGA
jgi:hypothetical protein